ncbi:MAG TPA: alpha/beta hydrolase [Anaerolineales bacterium]|nr:alpha/beta hydrolase [Anaerolineales bacterium]
MAYSKVNGVNLYYELHGSADKPLLVLNNGIIMNAATSWAFQTKVLSAHYRLLQYDCRGQALSDHPDTPYSMEIHADDLAGLMDELNIEKAHIAGISYGGELAQAFSLKYPQRTRSLVLIDTVSEVRPDLRLVIEGWMDALRSGDPDAFFHATVPYNFSADFIARNGPLLEEARKRYADLDFPAVLRLCEAFMDVNFTDRLGEIKSPVCIMVGEKDILKGLDYAWILKTEIPHAEMHILEGSGHASCWERPEEFNSVMLGFLAKQQQSL